jgi:hypothetical protein
MPRPGQDEEPERTGGSRGSGGGLGQGALAVSIVDEPGHWRMRGKETRLIAELIDDPGQGRDAPHRRRL